MSFKFIPMPHTPVAAKLELSAHLNKHSTLNVVASYRENLLLKVKTYFVCIIILFV